MNYIDLNNFFDSLNRNNIVELGIEQILFENINYISVYAIHYHNERDKDYFLISKISPKVGRECSINSIPKI